MPKPTAGQLRRVAVGLESVLLIDSDEAQALEVCIGFDDGPPRKRGQRRRQNSGALMLYSANQAAGRPDESLHRRAWRKAQRDGRVMRLARSPSSRDRAIACLYFDGLPLNGPMIEAAELVGAERLSMVAHGVLPWVAIVDQVGQLEPSAVAELARFRVLALISAGRPRRRSLRGRHSAAKFF